MKKNLSKLMDYILTIALVAISVASFFATIIK